MRTIVWMLLRRLPNYPLTSPGPKPDLGMVLWMRELSSRTA